MSACIHGPAKHSLSWADWGGAAYYLDRLARLPKQAVLSVRRALSIVCAVSSD
eukprot:COSAG01_NODE_6636_length_3568_cov_5.432113_4_plen_53_part_00